MLNDPMVVDQLTINNEDLNNIVRITQEEYDLISIKDPNMIYIIKGSYDHRIYYGDKLITHEKVRRMYLLGPSTKHNEYIIYLNECDAYEDHLIKISKFSNPRSAIEALNLYNRVGYHTQFALDLYNIIMSYISDDITLNEMIIGIITCFGYTNDTRLQEVIQIGVYYESDKIRKNLPVLLREELLHLKQGNNFLFKFYSNLYDLATIYGYFTGREFTDDKEHIDLSEVITKICDIFTQIR